LSSTFLSSCQGDTTCNRQKENLHEFYLLEGVPAVRNAALKIVHRKEPVECQQKTEGSWRQATYTSEIDRGSSGKEPKRRLFMTSRATKELMGLRSGKMPFKLFELREMATTCPSSSQEIPYHSFSHGVPAYNVRPAAAYA
jgi:hypothetical protein